MKPVIVNVASHGREPYEEGQLNLIRSCVNAGWDGDYFLRCVDGYCDEYLGAEIKLGSWPKTIAYGDCPGHVWMPYAFKPHAIQEARESGAEVVIWMDATCRMIKYPRASLAKAKEKGIETWNNLGWPVLPWTTNNAMRLLGETPESLQGVKQIMACNIIFDFRHPKAHSVFDRWLQASMDNTFYKDESIREGQLGNRHDQSCLSIILKQQGVEISDYGDRFCYNPHHLTNEHVIAPIEMINFGIKKL